MHLLLADRAVKICCNLIRCQPILPIVGRNLPPGNLEQAQMHREPHLISCVCTVPWNRET